MHVIWRTKLKEFVERANAHSFSPYDLHVILDALPTAMAWATLPEGSLQFTNRAFKTLFGYADGMFSTIDDWIEKAYVRAEHRAQSRRSWKELWKAPVKGISEVNGFEIEVRCFSGETRTVQFRAILLHEIKVGIATFEDVSDLKLAERALHRLAFEDTLTGLPNRRMLQNYWLDRLTHKKSVNPISTLLLIDLDGFKAVNDRFGHDAGDEVLIAVSNRIKESVRGGDLICRLGGDEFVVILNDVVSVDQVSQLCWRIEAALSRPIAAAGQSVVVGASIGASLFPQDAQDLSKLIKRADEALYRVKSAAKGGWQWFQAPAA